MMGADAGEEYESESVEEEFSMEDCVDLDDDYAMYAYRNDSRATTTWPCAWSNDRGGDDV